MPFIYNMKQIIALFTVLLLILGAGCSDSVRMTTNDHTYLIYGGIAKNESNDSIDISIYLERDSSAYNGAMIYIDDYQLPYDPALGLYQLTLDSAEALVHGGYTLTVSDGDFFEYSFEDSIPASTVISEIALNEDRINAGGVPVQIGWDLAPGTDGYLFTAVVKDSLYTYHGYTEFVENGFNLVNVPPDAFRLSGELDTGWYYVYVYSYTGSPVTDRNIPGPLIDGFLQNISETEISGMFGALVVSPYDSIHVTIQSN